MSVKWPLRARSSGQESRNELDRKIRVGDLPEGQTVHALPVDSRYFLDYLRMVVYRGETQEPAGFEAVRQALPAMLPSGRMCVFSWPGWRDRFIVWVTGVASLGPGEA